MKFIASSAAFAAFFVSAIAFAQTESPSDGVPLPDPSITTRDDATAIETNPAGLGFMRTVEFGYGFRLPVEDLDGVVPEGHALFWGMGSRFLSGGFGLQFVRRPELGGELQTYRKYTLSLAKSFRALSLGGSIHWFGSADSAELDDLISTEFGLQWRLSEYLGMGLVLKDINTPFVTDRFSLPLRVTWGFAIRLFDGRLILDPSITTSPREDIFSVTPRLVVEPFDGIRAFANAGFDFDNRPDSFEADFDRFGFGVSVALGAVGGDYSMQFEETNLDNNPRVAAFGAYTWLSPFKQRSMFESKKWIHIDLSKAYYEMPNNTFFVSEGKSFLSILNKIKKASEDPTVLGLVIAMGDGRVSWSNAWELVQAIESARAAGKETLALLPQAGIQQYYIASAAEKVWTTPSDTFHLGGLRGRSMTIRKALDQLGVEAQFIRIGDYKSAPEMFLLDEPSKEANAQKEAYIEAFWEEAVTQIAKARNKPKAEVVALLESDGLFPDEALKKGWVDALVYNDEADKAFRRSVSGGWPLVRSYPLPETREVRWERDPTIAVLVVEGNIVSGVSGTVPFLGDRVVGDRTIEKALDALARSSRVRAVVLRINSPGGSAAASDRMYRALRRLAQVKPVIASMGGTAASGGYYVAAGADEIWATPNTVTGSIGIFSGKFNAVQLLDKIGIKQHQIDRGNPVSFSPYNAWGEQEIKTVRKSINYLYRLFLHQIASTRGLNETEIDKVARGRVWVGKDAKAQKLVDKVGGLQDAIERAEELAGLAPGTSDVSLMNVGGAGFSLDFVFSKTKVSDELLVIRKLLQPFASVLSIPLLYRDGEALMLGDGINDGSN